MKLKHNQLRKKAFKLAGNKKNKNLVLGIQLHEMINSDDISPGGLIRGECELCDRYFLPSKDDSHTVL